jgi:hypothetical protein
MSAAGARITTDAPVTIAADMSKTAILITAAIAAAATASAFVFNPSPEQHRERIKQAIAERSPIAGFFGVGALTAFVSTYHPLGVASYTTVEGKVVSVGAFGQVFVIQPAQTQR